MSLGQSTTGGILWRRALPGAARCVYLTAWAGGATGEVLGTEFD